MIYREHQAKKNDTKMFDNFSENQHFSINEMNGEGQGIN